MSDAAKQQVPAALIVFVLGANALLAPIAMPDSRPMQDWEKEDADEFFWSQFA